MAHPLVSVLTPSFDYGRFIGDALESVIRQPLGSIEHIVQDGASEDDTVEVLQGYGKSVDWRSEPDDGQSDALNRAFSRATGEWIAWLNADEFYLPRTLAHLVDAGTKSKADIVYGDAVFVDENATFLRLLPQHRYTDNVLRWYGPFIPSCSVLLRRDILGHSPWDTECRSIMDYELYLRLNAEERRFVHVPIPVGVFRVHGARVTAQPREHFAEERQMVAQRYGLPRRGRLPIGRSQHGLLKIIDAAYFKQMRARRLKGSDLRWFLGEDQEKLVEALLSRSYPHNESP